MIIMALWVKVDPVSSSIVAMLVDMSNDRFGSDGRE
jgi:hypothetical protein